MADQVYDALDLASETPSERHARVLAENDADLLHDLVAIRKLQGLSQQDVADRLGITQASVAAFERYDNDPKLSTIRRYAYAVGAIVAHGVEVNRGQLDDANHWQSVQTLRFPTNIRAEVEPRGGWGTHLVSPGA